MTNHYTDEMGELVDNINDMSLKISQSEKMQTRVHLLRVPRAAHPPDRHQRLERDAAGREATGSRAAAPRVCALSSSESRRLTNMVEELLEFSKMQDGRFTLRIEHGGPPGGV